MRLPKILINKVSVVKSVFYKNSDKFSCLDATLYLKRSLGYNMAQTYIPTGLIVIISWISFWIDRRAVPARVTLSFTTLVSLTTLVNYCSKR